MKKRFIFFLPKPWPLANVQVYQALEKQFPDYTMEVVDIESMIKAYPQILFINLILTWLEYHSDILAGNKNFKEAFWRTPFILQTVRRMIHKRFSTNGFAFSFQMQSLIDCSIDGVPHFIYTDHTHLANLQYPNFDQKKLYPKKWLRFEQDLYDHAQGIFVRSSNILKSLKDQYGQPDSKVSVVFAGNNVESSRKRPSHKNYLKPNILFVGIDWKRKGGPELVEAFQMVQTRFPEAHLTIVGAAPELKIKNCTVVGKVPPEKLSFYYESATIFCLPTRIEPFGIVFLEAMQAGLPIIGTRVGAIPDFLEDGMNGYMIEPGDIHRLATALSALLEDPKQCALFGQRNFDLIQTKYNWTAVSSRIHDRILEIIE